MSYVFRPAVVLRFIVLLSLVTFGPRYAPASNWLTMPSTYTHDPSTGARVSQYSPIAAPTAAVVSNFQTSGYTHTRSSLAYGQSADNYHRVEQWGAPVRPYGEWRFPNRPYSSPYPNWGPPYAGLNLGLGGVYPGQNFPGQPYPGSGYPGFGVGPSYGPGSGYSGYPDGPENGPGHPGHSNRGLLRPETASPLNPYPSGPGSPYPVAPYYDGYYPVYRE